MRRLKQRQRESLWIRTAVRSYVQRLPTRACPAAADKVQTKSGRSVGLLGLLHHH